MAGLSPVLYRLFVQSLPLLIGGLSKGGEHINDHHQCPMSVFILTTSDLEANLKNQCMASVLYAHGEGGGVEGCREGEGGGSEPCDGPYLVVNRGLTVKSCPVSNGTYVMYNTPVGSSFSYLPFC